MFGFPYKTIYLKSNQNRQFLQNQLLEKTFLSDFNYKNTEKIKKTFFGEVSNRDFINQSPFLQSIFQTIGNLIGRVYEGMTNLPAVFAGVVAALKQLGTNLVNFFQTLYLDAQIFAEQVKGVFGTNVQAAIDDLRRRRAEANKDQQSLSDAFNKAYEESKKKSDAKREEDAKKAAIKINKVDQDANNAAIKNAQDAAKKLKEDREKFQQDEIKQAQQRTALLADLSAKLIEERIKNIKDGYQRELAEINNNLKSKRRTFKSNMTIWRGQQRKGSRKERFAVYRDDTPTDRFVVYRSAWWSYRDHSKLLTSKHYRHLTKLKRTDYKRWARGLKKCGYATAPKYAQILIAVIEKYELWRYDLK